MTETCSDNALLTAACMCGSASCGSTTNSYYCVDSVCYPQCVASTNAVRRACYTGSEVAAVGSLYNNGQLFLPCTTGIVVESDCACVNMAQLDRAPETCGAGGICSVVAGAPKCVYKCTSAQMNTVYSGKTCQCGNMACDLTKSQCFYISTVIADDGTAGENLKQVEMNGSTVGATCLPLCQAGVQARQTCLCDDAGTVTACYTNNICYSGKIKCSNGGIGYCDPVSGAQCGRGTIYDAKKNACVDQTTPCTLTNYFPDEASTCFCVSNNTVLSADRTCYKSAAGSFTYLFKCPYNRELEVISTVNNKYYSETCLCKNPTAKTGIYASVGMICRPDGTVACPAGEHFDAAGRCYKNCSSSAEAADAPGQVIAECYCGTATTACPVGNYCVGSTSTTNAAAQCVPACTAASVSATPGGCLCVAAAPGAEDIVYGASDAVCSLDACATEDTTTSLPSVSAHCLSYCTNTNTASSIAPTGGCACQAAADYSYRMLYLKEGGVCLNVKDAANNFMYQPCAADYVGTDKCHCGSTFLITERQYCISDADDSFISPDALVDCTLVTPGSDNSADYARCGEHHLCSKAVGVGKFVCYYCGDGKRVVSEAGAYSCLPLCDDKRKIGQKCACVGAAAADGVYGICPYDANAPSYCDGGACTAFADCRYDGSTIEAAPCTCGSYQCGVGAICMTPGLGENYCACAPSDKILYGSENGCQCGSVMCGVGAAKQVCNTFLGASGDPPHCYDLCEQAAASAMEAECACVSHNNGELPGVDSTVLVDQGDFCDDDGVVSRVCPEGAPFASSGTITTCSCGGFGTMCGNGQYCNSQLGVCVAAISGLPACANDPESSIVSPGCVYNSTSVCAAGNTFDGTTCSCARDVLLAASACSCNGASYTRGVCVFESGAEVYYPLCSYSDTAAAPTACACAGFGGKTYEIIAAGGLCRVDRTALPGCAAGKVALKACFCSASVGGATCAASALCDSSAADAAGLCVPACSALQMSITTLATCTCGGQTCLLGSDYNPSEYQCYNSMSNQDGSSNGSFCVKFAAGDTWQPEGSSTPYTPVTDDIVRCAGAGVCHKGNFCVQGFQVRTKGECGMAATDPWAGPCVNCSNGAATETCSEYQMCANGVGCKSTPCANGGKGPCVNCGSETVNCRYNQKCDTAAKKCTAIDDVCLCADGGIGPCQCGGVACKEGQKCKITGTAPALEYVCEAQTTLCGSAEIDTFLAVAQSCRCGSTPSCMIYAAQACVQDQCLKRCQPGTIRSACACEGASQAASLATKGQTCEADGTVICSKDRINEAHCVCGNVSCNAGTTCAVDFGIGTCASVYCTSGKSGTSTTGGITFPCYCGQNVDLCTGNSACIGSTSTRGATAQCFPLCTEEKAGATGCACSSSSLTDTSGVCEEDAYCTGMGGSRYATAMRADAKCLPACGHARCDAECRCSADPTKKACQPGQHCVLQWLDKTKPMPPYPGNQLPHSDYTPLAECSSGMKPTQVCACGPGDWDLGVYYGMSYYNCVRCIVNSVTYVDCQCTSLLNDSGVAVTENCSSEKACVTTGQTAGNGSTREACLDYCVNSDTNAVTVACACALDRIERTKTAFASVGSFCYMDGSVLAPCTPSTATQERCACGASKCELGQTCNGSVCENPTPSCGANAQSPAQACMCGGQSCYYSTTNICYEETPGGPLQCIQICTATTSPLEDCICETDSGELVRALPEMLCDALGAIAECASQRVNPSTRCWCNPLLSTADVLQKTETTTFTENVACFSEKPLPMCYNHNAMPQPQDCACAASYEPGAVVNFVPKGSLCKYSGAAQCTDNASCAEGQYCGADGFCTTCESLFSKCTKCADASECLGFTACDVAPFYLDGGKCKRCEGTLQKGKCVSGGGLSAGAIAGIAIGCVVVCAAVGVGIWFAVRRMRNRARQTSQKSK